MFLTVRGRGRLLAYSSHKPLVGGGLGWGWEVGRHIVDSHPATAHQLWLTCCLHIGELFVWGQPHTLPLAQIRVPLALLPRRHRPAPWTALRWLSSTRATA